MEKTRQETENIGKGEILFFFAIRKPLLTIESPLLISNRLSTG